MLRDGWCYWISTGSVALQDKYQYKMITASLQLLAQYYYQGITGSSFPEETSRAPAKNPPQEPRVDPQRARLAIAAQRAITRQLVPPKPGSPSAVIRGPTFGNRLSVAKTCSPESCTRRSLKRSPVVTCIGSHQVMSLGGGG